MSEDLNLPASLQRLEITPERSDCLKFEENNPFSLLRTNETQPECFLENLSLKSVCSKGNCHCNKKKENKDDAEATKSINTAFGEGNVNESTMCHGFQKFEYHSWRPRWRPKMDDGRDSNEALRRTRRGAGSLRRPVLRRSRLANTVLRAPMLKLSADIKCTPPVDQLATASVSDCLTSSSSADSSAESTGPESSLYRSSTEDDEAVQLLNGAKSLLRAPVLRLAPSQPAAHAQRSSIPVNRCGGEQAQQRTAAMCAIQARNPAPDDTSIEELASYFDLFVHIPKKMSVMAEMMYI